MILIKINYENLKKTTSILLDNINKELKNTNNYSKKVALFYTNIDDKHYYYSYNFADELMFDLYNSYHLVDIKDAKRLLLEQMEG